MATGYVRKICCATAFTVITFSGACVVELTGKRDPCEPKYWRRRKKLQKEGEADEDEGDIVENQGVEDGVQSMQINEPSVTYQ